ncbi:MAG: DUF6362 family protein [Acidocella sp.]|nr:DUF6362 family protein [Acidocella sp.]
MSHEASVLSKRQVLSSGIKSAEVRVQRYQGLSTTEIVERFEAAGATLLAMPARGYSTHMRTINFDVVHSALDAYGWSAAAIRPPAPSSAEITAMDETFGWLALIPESQYVLRRIVGARALVHPLSGRHLFPWRRIAVMLGADHKSIQRWHGHAVELILKKLIG